MRQIDCVLEGTNEKVVQAYEKFKDTAESGVLGLLQQIRAIAFGELFALPMGYPAMIVGNDQVHGYLLSFKNASILESLDDLEDYQCDRLASENAYNREQIEVFDLVEKSLGMAWAYLMTSAQVVSYEGIAQVGGWWSA